MNRGVVVKILLLQLLLMPLYTIFAKNVINKIFI